MNEELQAHKTSDKIKWILTLIAFVVTGVMLAGIIAGWFDKKDEVKEPEQAAVIAQRNIAVKSSLSVTDDKAAFDNAVYDWVRRNDYEEGSDDEGYDDWCDSSSYDNDNVIVKRTVDGKTFKLDELNTNYTCVINSTSSGGGCADYYDYYYFVVREGNIFPDYPENNFTIVVSGNEKSSFDYLDYQMIYLGYSYSSDEADYIPENTTPNVLEITYTTDETLKPIKTVPLPSDPVKEGYTFIGWYLDEALTLPYDNRPIYEDTQLYAKFEINKYTVTLDSDNGSEAESKTVEWNTVLTLTEPERTGYNFVGWYREDGTKYEGEPVTSDLKLTAHWEIKMITVTFYVDGEVYTTCEIEYGSKFEELIEQAKALNLKLQSIELASGEKFTETSQISEDIKVEAAKTDDTALKIASAAAGIAGVSLLGLGIAKLVKVIKRKRG